ncbi:MULTISPECIES: nucleotidyl transferase AbiEii/AbiGii toxin family protein [Vibrio]|uniref:Nucleotidyl transferase AbiEii/AbiGii toxin family protein n=1 Tax=Vibrio kanaloae TaxID=170673 RepID=A0ABV4LD18_9VIBR|nr:nucleotidyl transferase AbiEii/AbiGii toxin family protein [Vibrio kanaloae]OEF15591.1 hypothetical protein A132_17195 [Vibrio kanaloae 5S-149]
MSQYSIKHHQVIESALKNFNADFFCENQITFGGGTRIALELNEFRESIDIDFLCPNKASYRAVREQVTNVSLGSLVHEQFEYAREIMANRYGVRVFIKYQETLIKLEFVSFDNYELTPIQCDTKFPVPYLDQRSCFYTKLLSNSDRKLQEPYKDILDILAMYKSWGSIPDIAITQAESHNGKIIVRDLKESLQDIIDFPEKYIEASEVVKMNSEWVDDIVKNQPIALLNELNITYK